MKLKPLTKAVHKATQTAHKAVVAKVMNRFAKKK